MKKILSKLSIFVVTFLFSVGGLLFWVYLFPKQESFEEVDFSALPAIEYCDLRNDPWNYSGRIVRANADMYWFMHGLFLYDEQCGRKTLYNYSDDHRTAISFYKSKSEEINGSLSQFKPFSHRSTYRITAIGRFNNRRPKGFSDSIEDRTSFHFEVFKIENVEEKPK